MAYRAYPLGAIETQKLLDPLWNIARTIFPKETAKAQAWVMQQAQQQGIAYAKDYVEQKAADAGANPLVWAALGLGAVGLVFGLMRRR
jgi:uncharacterized protein HemX